MDSIMQGTTPALTIKISPTDFQLADVVRMELYVQNGKNLLTYTDAELIVDAEENTVTRSFTEEETAAFSRKYNILVQARFWFQDNSVVGINRITLSVADMLGVGD